MRLQLSQSLPIDVGRLVVQLNDVLVKIVQQVNGISEGVGSAFHGARTSVPATGTWSQGDFVKKSNPVEAGVAGSKYIITGWVRVTSGTGNTLNTDWFEARVLTGN